MQNQYLPVSIGGPETPSGGVSPTPFGAHSDQSLWSRLLVPGKALEWSHTDASLGGKIEFVTTLDITGQISSGVEGSALLRLACVYVIAHLSSKALIDAYQALVDLYRWQTDRLNAVPTITYGQRIAVTNVREVQRVPFVFNEE